MSTRALPRRLVAFVLATVAVLAVGACTDEGSSSSDPVTIQQVRDATFAAGSARYEGEVRFEDDSSAPLAGVAAGEPAEGEVTFPILTTTGVQEAGLVWVDGVLYIRRAVGQPAGGGLGVLTRAEGDQPWVKLPVDGIGSVALVPYDPFALLAQLGSQNLGRQDGTESLDGRTLDRFVAESQLEGAAVVSGFVRRVELLADNDHRLVLARLIGDQTIEYQLSDFGTAVSATPPPDDEIAVGGSQDAGEEPIGDYEQVASGTGVVDWRLLRAPATNGGACWRLDTQEALAAVAATESDGATCLAALDPSVDEPVQFVVDAGSAAPFDALVAVLPGGSRAQLVFADRTRQDLTVDPQGFLVWVGPKEPMPVVLDVDLPDGSQSACGPGSVSSLEDLESLGPDELASLRDAPWLCLPA